MTYLLNRMVVSAGILSATLWAQTSVQTVFIHPDQVESGKPFQVTLSGKSSLCNPQFSHHQVSVGNGSIQLTVMAVNDPLAKCTAGDHDYKTDFELPALKAGQYAVTASLEPACRYSTPACMIPQSLENAGTLYAKDSASLPFAIRPGKVDPAKSFDMLVTNNLWTCANEFTNPVVLVDGHAIYVSFTNRFRSGILCPAILKDYGPTLSMAALPSGTYQILTTSIPYCDPKLICPLSLLAPQLSGALTVSGSPTVINGKEKSLTKKAQSYKGALRIDAIHNALGRKMSLPN
jgi:hypothetical protein